MASYSNFASLGVALVAAAALASSACRNDFINQLHCVRNEGDATCALYYPDGSRPYCGGHCVDTPDDDGCVVERPADDCYAPCGGGRDELDVGPIYVSDGIDLDCEGIATQTGTETDPTMTMGPGPGTMPSTGPTTTTTPTTGETETDTASDTETGGGCMDPSDCPAATPACVDEVCVACGQAPDPDAACADFDPASPLCVGDVCVQCTDADASACPDTSPICNAVGTCTPCSFHFECRDIGAPACHIAEGSCFDPKNVMTYNLGGGDLQSVIGGVPSGVPTAIELTGSGGAMPAMSIENGQIIALISEGQTDRTILVDPGQSAVLSITGGLSVAYVEHLQFDNNGDGVGVSVDGGILYLDESQVTRNDDGGVVVSGGAEAFLRNCLVGGDTNDVAALSVNDGSVDVLYTTLAMGFGTSRALRCNSPDSVDVRNSVLVTRDASAEIECPEANIVFSATESAFDGMGNRAVGDMETTWFSNFANGDLTLTTAGGTEFADIAQWEDGDPPFDIEGVARPNIDGMSDVAGADLP